MCVTAVVTSPAPVSAELTDQPTTSWGVSGLATGTFTDTIKSEVWAIEQIGNRVYVGGRFTDVTNGNQSIGQPFIAAFDATSGVYISSFAPQLDNAVFALEAAPDGSKLFVAGSFTTVNGVSTGGLVALDPTTGDLDSWPGRIGGYNLVRNLDLVGDYLYAAGSFQAVNSPAGNNTAWGAARFDWQSGDHDSAWRPVVSGGSVWGIAASEVNDRVYLAGAFTQVNGEARPGGFAAINASNDNLATGVLPFLVNTQNVSRQYLYDVVTVNGLVFTGGSEHFVQVLNESDLSLVKFHISEPNRGDYQDIEVVGDRVYAGCHCRLDQALNSSDGVRWFGPIPAGETNAPVTGTSANSWVMALDANTGQHVETFVPDVNSSGPGIWAIHGGDDGCVWFGGNITRWGGTTQRNVSRLCEGGGNGGDTERPSTPGRPQIQNVGPDSVDLAWNASTDNVGVAGYRIYNNANGAVLLDVNGTSGTITGLAPGTYEIYTKSYDAAGNESYRSGFTNVVITGNNGTDTERPSTPGRPQIQNVGPDSVDLAWNASTDNVGVAGYRIYNNANGAVLLDVNGTSGTITGLAPGTYEIYTKSYDAAGNESYRSGFTNVVITGNNGTDTERPSTPTGLVLADADAVSVDLTWNPSTDNVGVAGYRIFNNADGSVVADVNSTLATVNLSPGTYTFFVKAYDAAGNLSWRTNLVTVTL